MDLPQFRFFLNFINDNTGQIEISEPEGFDASSFTIESESDNLGLDVRYMNQDLNLTFNEGFYELAETEQMMPNGEITYHLTQGLPFILDYKKRFGFESIVEFILWKDGLTFVTGVLDYPKAKTDGLTKFSCGIIDNDLKAKLKRNWEVNVDLFSDKDLDGNDIDPTPTTNILLKAKPVRQLSSWGNVQSNIYNFFSGLGFFSYHAANNIANILTYGIEDTLTYIQATPPDYNDRVDLTYIRAKTNLANVNVKITIKAIAEMVGSSFDSASYSKFSINYYIGTTIDNSTTIPAENKVYLAEFDGVFDVEQTIDTIVEFNGLSIPAGNYLWIWFEGGAFRFELGNTVLSTRIDESSIEISATSTAIDSVVKGIRWGQLIEENVKRTNTLPAILPRFQEGGEFYDQFVFNGKLIRQFTDKPFYVNLKDTMGTLNEVNGGYRINKENVFVGIEEDFYPNVELASFSQIPDSDYEEGFNVKTAINRTEFNYKTFESDRDEKNTLDSMHTQSQFKLPNTQVENNKKIEVEQIRDANSIESARRQGIDTKDTTSLDNDDKIFMLDCIPLEEGTLGGFSQILLMRILGTGNLEILNNTLDGSGVPFNWGLLGFIEGSSFTITEGQNIGDWLVVNITPSVLELSPVTVSSTPFTGDSFITVTYELNGVTYVNRTSEGFTEINNILNGGNYANLLFTPKRNLLKYYGSYLATCCENRPTEQIKNTFFKNNGEAETNFNGEGLVKENAVIDISDLPEKHITTGDRKTRVFCSFADALDIIENEQQGFIRTMDNKGAVVKIYPAKLDYEWGTETMEITGNVKAEPDIVTIVSSDGIITINDVGYDASFVTEGNFQTSNDFLQMFDVNSVALINPTNYTKISVNGVIYENILDLADAINSL